MKRRVKPVESQASILDFELGESSSDSDFRIEDHADISDDDSINSDGEGNVNSSGGSDSTDDSDEDSDIDSYKKTKLPNADLSIADVIQEATKQNAQLTEKEREQLAQVQICCGCLGDQSDGSNEIVECDSCGATVHEACYGCSDSVSLSSTDSLSPTAPWFCDTCKAGAHEPICELCPNTGGIFKETDVGRWVHLVCALYVPGVAFGEVDRLSGVTLFEMPYSRWGAKACCLCPDQRLARTGVCIGCDAGMCRTYFHVTCAQREGFLSEAHTEEVDQADPFYAHCRLHSDKTMVRRRKRNYLALELRTHLRQVQFSRAGHADSDEQVRIRRKLEKQRVRYLGQKRLKQAPWVPTQKMPRLLTTSASACRRLLAKAELMGVDSAVQEMHEAHTAALADIRKKWNIAPAFTVEFIAYYLDRNERMREMKEMLQGLLDGNKVLLGEQGELRNKYDMLLNESTEQQRTSTNLRHLINIYQATVTTVCPSKRFPPLDAGLPKPVFNALGAAAAAAGGLGVNSSVGNAVRTAPQQMMVPTAAALKMGVGFPLGNTAVGKDGSGRVLSSHARSQAPNTNTTATPLANHHQLPHHLHHPPLNYPCGICRQPRDQHLMAKCDTCHLHYHLGCLQPPLTRPPKKSKLYGWQCSECDRTGSEGEEEEGSEPEQGGGVRGEAMAKKAVRRSRTRFSKGEDGAVVRELIVDNRRRDEVNTSGESEEKLAVVGEVVSESKRAKTPKPRQIKDRKKSVTSETTCIEPDRKSIQIADWDKSTNNEATHLQIDSKPVRGCNKKQKIASGQAIIPIQPVIQQIQPIEPVKPDEAFNNGKDEELQDETIEIIGIIDKKPAKKAKGKGKKVPQVVIPEEIPIETRLKIVKIKPLEPKSDDVELATPTVTLQLHQYSPAPPPITTIPAPPPPQPTPAALTTPTVITNNPTMDEQADSSHITTIDDSFAQNNDNADDPLQLQGVFTSGGKAKKRRREKHRNRYSPDGDNSCVPLKEHKRKRKKKCLDIEKPSGVAEEKPHHPRITIKIKSIPLPAGEVASVSNPQCFYVNNESNDAMQFSPILSPAASQAAMLSPPDAATVQQSQPQQQAVAPKSPAKSPRALAARPSTPRAIPVRIGAVDGLGCDVCKDVGVPANLVQCDECQKNYHFTCLDPPLKKTPKKRGYSWHCADCDPTGSE